MSTRYRGKSLPASWRPTLQKGSSPGLDLANQPLVSRSFCNYKLVPAPRRQCSPGDQGTRPMNLPLYEPEQCWRLHQDKIAGCTCSPVVRLSFGFPSCWSYLSADPGLARQQGLSWRIMAFSVSSMRSFRTKIPKTYPTREANSHCFAQYWVLAGPAKCIGKSEVRFISKKGKRDNVHRDALFSILSSPNQWVSGYNAARKGQMEKTENIRSITYDRWKVHVYHPPVIQVDWLEPCNVDLDRRGSVYKPQQPVPPRSRAEEERE